MLMGYLETEYIVLLEDRSFLTSPGAAQVGVGTWCPTISACHYPSYLGFSKVAHAINGRGMTLMMSLDGLATK